jgi:ATP-dependent exoDNAse (exonuclease V) beta subunit
MQLLQWDNENSWQSVFDLRHQQAPDEKRFSHEWKLFRDWFGRGEDVRPTDDQAHVELPFLWRMTDRNCLEGIIDLAFADADRRRWLIIDWKTNQIGGTRADADALKEQYRLQIAAYWKALSATTGMPVDAALFSTATGKLLRYEEAAMKEAWRTFEGFPPGEQARQLDLF